MKIWVYAIAKNEEQFVDRFLDGCRGADGVCVLDTGSDDHTVEKLADRGCIVHQEVIQPWRFDAARNRSLELLPEDVDVAVCVDLDEVLSDGWREELEKAWTEDTVLARFTCVRSRNGDGSAGTSFLIGRAHRPGCFRWKYPVHEVLEQVVHVPRGKTVDVPNMEAEHLPDPGKSRGQYLPLLELGAREYPEDPRCAHYLGREYMYYRRWEDAIHELERHLSLHKATWREERAASMRYLAECYLWGKNKPQTAFCWAMRAIAEVPDLRENWYEAEKIAYYRQDWEGTDYFGYRALGCKKSPCCINEGEAWGAAPYDLLAVANWNLGKLDRAEEYARQAAALRPEDGRLQNNLDIIRKARKEAGA